MRTIVAALLAVGAFALSGGPAAAQTYPWCGEYLSDDGGGTNCGFSTLAQCRAAISGNGGHCYENPFYTAQTREPRRTKR
jgi:hypothetical protein